MGLLIVRITESISNPLLQPAPTAPMMALPGVLMLKSEPLAAKLLHFIFLLSRTLTCLPSQAAAASLKRGSNGSVMLAVPPVNTRSYPCVLPAVQLVTISKYCLP